MIPELHPKDDPENGLGWHALNYRTAHTVHAQAMWLELEQFVRLHGESCYRAGLERAAQIATSFATDADNIVTAGAWDNAIDTCATAIRAAANPDKSK